MVIDLLSGLSPAQADAVRAEAAPLAVVAGPGAGKTRVLTRRVAWRCRHEGIDPAHVLVLTFSRRAASELLGRLGGLGLPAGARNHGVAAGTFHALAWAEVSRHRAERGQRPPVVISRPGRLLRPALADVLGRPPEPAEVAALAGDIGWARAQLATWPTYAERAGRAGRAGLLPPAVVADAWASYTATKARRGVGDLDDLLDAARRLLGDEATARAARWRHRHVFVDEYQDLNPAHQALLTAWVGGRTDLCIVGDPDQAVYGFNGASPDLFGRVHADWPGITVLELRANFRSSAEIIALAEATRPRPVSGAPEAGALPSAPAGTGGSRPPGPLPTLTGHADADAEAEAVARAVHQEGGAGRAWAGLAVLARTNARLHVVAAALTREGVPWRLRDARPLSERPTVRAWLDGLPASAPAADLTDGLDTLPAPGERELARAALDEFLRSGAPSTVRAFNGWLDASGVSTEETWTGGVELVTFHRAKGLEWPKVWIVGVEEGHVPLASVTDPAGMEEERRLLYVAVTRAQEQLHLSWATSHRWGDGTAVPRRPSRWIGALEDARGALATEPSADGQRARLAAVRRAIPTGIDGAEGIDPRAAEGGRRRALTTWRASRARAARVPAALILPDALLASLARRGPIDPDEVIRMAGPAGRRLAHWAPEVAAILGGTDRVA